jgi:hypothetical protein
VIHHPPHHGVEALLERGGQLFRQKRAAANYRGITDE